MVGYDGERMNTDPDSDAVELARWLEEAGRRKAVSRPASIQAESASRPEKKARRLVTQPLRIALLALMVLSYLQYFYLDVYLQIAAMPSITVFI